MKQYLFPYGILVGLALIGIAVLLFATAWGIGVSPDSVRYFDLARNVAQRRAFVEQVSDGRFVPMTHWLPLFPLSLGAMSWFGLDPWPGARLLNTFLFGINILLVGLIIYEATGRSKYLALFGSFMMLTSLNMLQVHSMAWSEPLFFFLGFTGMFMLSFYLKGQKAWWLLLTSAAFVSLACFDRHVGIVLIFSGIVALTFLNQSPVRKKVLEIIVFTTLSGLLTALWSLRNLQLTGALSGRTMKFNPNINLLFRTMRLGLDTVSQWLLPDTVFRYVRYAIAAIVIIIVVSLLIRMLWNLVKRNRFVSTQHDFIIPYLFIIFSVFYVGSLATTLLFHYASTPLDYRLLSPLYISTLIIITSLGYRSIKERDRAPLVSTLLVLFCIILAGSYLWRSAVWVMETHHSGLGFASRSWQQSELIAEIKRLDPDAKIYTNGVTQVRFLTGRFASGLPIKVNTYTGLPNDKFTDQLSLLEENMKREGAVLVYFNNIAWWSGYIPSEEEIREAIALSPVKQGEDGTIFEAKEVVSGMEKE